MKIRIGDLEPDDILLDEEGDVFIVAEFSVFPGVNGLRRVATVDLQCITNPVESIVWRSGPVDIGLASEWVWHSRYGCLLDD